MKFQSRIKFRILVGTAAFVLSLAVIYCLLIFNVQYLFYGRVIINRDASALMAFSCIWPVVGVFAGIFIRSVYISNADTEVQDLGTIEIQKRIGAYEDELASREPKK